MRRIRKSRLFFFLAFIVLAAVIYTFVRQQVVTVEGASDLDVVEELYTLIEEQSVYDLDSGTIVEGALRGMASAIKDPYSSYYSKEEAAIQKASLAGEKVGIGVEIAEKNGKFIVISPVKSSPAEKAGIRPYDEIVQINDVRLDGKTIGEVIKLMQGKAGEEVTLVLYRPSIERHIKVAVERAKMENDTVDAKVVTVENVPIGYVTISLFAENTLEQWLQEVSKLIEQDVQALIVDVRDNPGGYLHSVAGIISTIGEEGKVFAYMQDGKGKLEPLKTVKLDEIEGLKKEIRKLPIVILQNEGSASASEVFSAAMQSWGKGTLVGGKSFGKGTVQETWDLANGGSVKLSTNKWLTPKETWINGKGIKPDVEVDQHPLYMIEFIPVRGSFEVGDFSEEVAYAQKVLHAFGFQIVRQDGYFDETTREAVVAFREKYDLHDGDKLDELFFEKMQEQVALYKSKAENDLQLQMAVSYVMHKLGH
ncbi:S41 family peptidase [Lysinibacillus sp. KU-BSD001]|uniref:S41 family peptidase n=1 Tax=Lysinibacillus sp. KU-BSD001 TaxID=3141328 RepID=UPI0036E7D765